MPATCQWLSLVIQTSIQLSFCQIWWAFESRVRISKVTPSLHQTAIHQRSAGSGFPTRSSDLTFDVVRCLRALFFLNPSESIRLFPAQMSGFRDFPLPQSPGFAYLHISSAVDLTGRRAKLLKGFAILCSLCGGGRRKSTIWLSSPWCRPEIPDQASSELPLTVCLSVSGRYDVAATFALVGLGAM